MALPTLPPLSHRPLLPCQHLLPSPHLPHLGPRYQLPSASTFVLLQKAMPFLCTLCPPSGKLSFMTPLADLHPVQMPVSAGSLCHSRQSCSGPRPPHGAGGLPEASPTTGDGSDLVRPLSSPFLCTPPRSVVSPSTLLSKQKILTFSPAGRAWEASSS